MPAAPAHDEYTAAPILEHLNREVRRTAEAIQADGTAGAYSRPLNRAIADDPGAEKRAVSSSPSSDGNR